MLYPGAKSAVPALILPCESSSNGGCRAYQLECLACWLIEREIVGDAVTSSPRVIEDCEPPAASFATDPAPMAPLAMVELISPMAIMSGGRRRTQ